MSVEEYQVAQLYSVAEASKNETGGGEGVEVLKNEPFDNVPLFNGKFTKGQYTRKIYHLNSRLPTLVKTILEGRSSEIVEEAWNAYPYCKTVLSNPGGMEDYFYIIIETLHLPDDGQQDNVHELDRRQKEKRTVDYIDIANDAVTPNEDEDPTTYQSEKTGRGPLTGPWQKDANPKMTAYILVSVLFKWFGLQTRCERIIMNTLRRLFLKFYRQVFCSTDKWYGMTMEDIRELEDKTKHELDEERSEGEIRGTMIVED